MRIPNWLAWWWIKGVMRFAAVRLWLRGMGWVEANRRVAEATKLYMHREVCPQFGPRALVDPVNAEKKEA